MSARPARARRKERVRPAMGGSSRPQYGFILSFENSCGQTLSLHKKGPILKWVREACAGALALDSSFRVVAYSTPDTILGDLQGAREPIRVKSRAGHVGVSREALVEPVLPEMAVLARAGLRELLHPRLARRPLRSW